MKNIYTLCVLAIFTLCSSSVVGNPLLAVLTDNPSDTEPGIRTGATYTDDPAFDNPADPNNTRIIDRDPFPDWTTTAGINFKDQTVTFDLKKNYRVGKVQLLFDMQAKPAYVDISTSHNETDWSECGRIKPETRNGWYELKVEKLQLSRYVKLFFKLNEWGWYVRECKIWGKQADEPQPGAKLKSESSKAGIIIARNGKPQASIVVSNSPSSKVAKAAFELQDYLYAISGARLAIHTESEKPSGTQILVGPSKAVASMKITAPKGYPNAERIILKTVGNKIAILGNDDAVYSGTQFAVQEFLGKLGCGWYGPDQMWQPVHRLKTVAVPVLNVNHKPDFELRSVWIGQAGRWFLGGPPLNCSHAHDALFPPAQYFAEHPEYYALIGGKRTSTGEWQLCTSNPDVRRVTVEKAKAFFELDSNQVMFSLSNNDCGGFCECSECLKTGSNPAARMLDFCNYVSRELRKTRKDRWILFYAYWYTHDAPTGNMKAEPGVCVMTINQGCHAHPITDPNCPANVVWKANFEKWCATGAKMAIYEWYIPGCSEKIWQKLPWVSGETAIQNLRYWKSKGVDWVTYESQTAYEDKPYPLRWPLFYVVSKGMWDIHLSADFILTDACKKLYGPAAKEMREYYKVLETAVRSTKLHSGNWNMPDPRDIYNSSVRVRAGKLLEQARLKSIKADAAVQQRIEQETEVWAEAGKALDREK